MELISITNWKAHANYILGSVSMKPFLIRHMANHTGMRTPQSAPCEVPRTTVMLNVIHMKKEIFMSMTHIYSSAERSK